MLKHGVSLTTRLEYELKRSLYTETSNLCSWHFPIYVELPSKTLGLLSPRRGCMSRHYFLSGIMMSQSEMELP